MRAEVIGVSVLVLIYIQGQRDAHLAEAVLAGGGMGAGLRRGERGQQQGSENADDADHRQEFDERKGPLVAGE
jgi:hypothetical protein